MIVCIGHHCTGIACYSRWCCDVHRLQSHDHIFTCICMSTTCSLGLGSLSIEHPTVHSVWAAWQLLKFVPQHIGFVLNCGMAHVVPPLMLVACLQLAFITCSLDMQPFSGGLFFFENQQTSLSRIASSIFHLSVVIPDWDESFFLSGFVILTVGQEVVRAHTDDMTNIIHFLPLCLDIFRLLFWYCSFIPVWDGSGMGILSWPSTLEHFAQWIGLATFHIVFGITCMSSQTGMTLRQWNMPTLPCYFLLVHNWCTLHMLTFKDCHILFSIVCLVTVILSSQTGMTWFSMSDNTIHPSLGWAQHIRASQIYQK